MKQIPLISIAPIDPPAGPYDAAPPDDGDLWFLPEAEPDTSAIPGPKPDQRPLFDAREWAQAERLLAPDLAALCYDFGRLAERMATFGAGALHWLALREIAGLGWWTGDRISEDRLALWMLLRVGGAGDDTQALSRAAWAVRRLTAGPGSLVRGAAGPDWAMRIAAHLGADGPPRDRMAEAAEAMAGMAHLHPVVQGAVLFHIWRMLCDDRAQDTEAAVLGAKVAGGPAGFMPLTLAGMSAVATSGPAVARLTGWISGGHQAVLAALLQLNRWRDWRQRADIAVADLQGRTPAALIATLAKWPLLTAEAAEAELGASRATVQRNLDALAARGLIREVTGQGRYRVWAAQLL